MALTVNTLSGQNRCEERVLATVQRNVTHCRLKLLISDHRCVYAVRGCADANGMPEGAGLTLNAGCNAG